MAKSKSKKPKFRPFTVNNSASTSDTGTIREQKNDYKGGKKSPDIQDEGIAPAEDSNLKTSNASEVASSSAMGLRPETVADEISHSSETTSESTNEFCPMKIDRDVTYSKNSSSDNYCKSKREKYEKHNDSNYASPHQPNIEEENLNERTCVDSIVNTNSVQVDSKSTTPDEWNVDVISDIAPDCSQGDVVAKRPLWNPDASEFKPKSNRSGLNEQTANISYNDGENKSYISEQYRSDNREKKETENEIVYSHQQKTVDDTCYRRDGNGNYHKQTPGFSRSDHQSQTRDHRSQTREHRSQTRQFVNTSRRGPPNDYSQEDSRTNNSDTNRRSQQNKPFNERGRGRFSSNLRDDGSQGYGGRGKFNEREIKNPFGKKNSTFTHNKHEESVNSESVPNWDADYNAQPSYTGCENPQGPTNSTGPFQNEATSYRQQNIESISNMNIRDVDNNSAKVENKSFNERGRGRVSSNYRNDKSEGYRGRGKFDRREKNHSYGKRDSTFTHNKHEESGNSVSEQNWDAECNYAQPYCQSYENPQVATNSTCSQNEATSYRQQDIESISKMNIGEVDNNNAMKIKKDTEFLPTPKKPQGISGPRMERERESKQQSNENWQKITSRKQRKPSRSPQNVDISERTDNQSTSLQDDNDWDSNDHEGRGKYNQREKKHSYGKRDSTFTHNKHEKSGNSDSKSWDAECTQSSYTDYEKAQGATNSTGRFQNETTSYSQQDIESISKMNIREVLRTSQKPQSFSDPRMEREKESKQQSNEKWQTINSRKQRKPSPSPQNVDISERTEKQNISLQDDNDWDSNDHEGRGKYNQREKKHSYGKRDSTFTHNKHEKSGNSDSKSWDAECTQSSYTDYEKAQGATNSTGRFQNETTSYSQQDIESISKMNIREVLRTSQKPQSFSDPRMEREKESKQQSNEKWQTINSRKQRKPSPSPQNVDISERTEKQNISPQDDNDCDSNDVSNSENTQEFDSWNDKHVKQRKSFPESKPKHETERKSVGGRIEMSSKEDYDRSYEKTDVEYREFNEKFRWNGNFDYIKVTEKVQDLFELAKDYSYSLGHCVAEDFRMGSGIAVTFKRDFKGLDDLLSQRQKQGGMAVLENNNRYIYYLVTKKISTGKPTYETFWSSLKTMRDHIVTHKVQKLAIPKIGCGLDRLDWDKVKYMIEFLFKDVDVEIIVCNFQQMDDSPQKDNLSTRLVYHHEPLKDIDEYTIILYFSTEDGHISKEMEELDIKFNFLPGFRRSFKKFGFPIRHEIKNYILYGCIVRQKLNDLFDFKSFAKCLSEINKNNRKDEYQYVALQPVYVENDDLLNEKVITLLRNYLKKVDIYICSGKTPEEQ